MRRPFPLRLLWISILGLVILGQTAFFVQDYVRPWGWRVKQVWDAPRLLRSADMSMGARAARIVVFVNDQVPADGTIILPPRGDPGRFALERSMQYFFFPRQVVECGRDGQPTCLERDLPAGSYALVTERPDPSDHEGEEFLPAPEGSGWFVGIIGSEFGGPGIPDYTLREAVTALAGDLGLLLLFGILGAVLIGAIGAHATGIDHLALSIPVGGGTMTWILFLLSWQGVRLSPWTTAGAALGMLITAFLLVGRTSTFFDRSWWRERPAFRMPKPIGLALIAGGVVLLGMAVGMSVGTSYRLFDPVQIWSVKGYGIGHEGSIRAAQDWGVHGLAYPLNIPMQISAFYQLNGDLLPGSKLLFPIYGLTLGLTIYSFLRKQEVDSRLAGLGALLVASMPTMLFHASSGLTNLPYSAYVVAGALWTLQGVTGRSWRDQALGSLLLGLAAWTRPEGVLFCIAIVVVAYLMSRRQVSWDLRLPTLLPLLVIAGTWYVFTLAGGHFTGSILHDAVDEYASETTSGVLQLEGLFTLIRVFSYSMFVPYLAMFPAISATNWGLLFPVILFLLIWRVGDLHPGRNPEGFALALMTMTVGAATVAVFYLPSYSMGNYEAFIERAFPRGFLPTAILMTVLAIWLLARRLAPPGSPGQISK